MKSIVKQKNKSINSTGVESEKKSNASAKITQIAHEQYLGPIPHPKILTQYEQIIPDAANRILEFSLKGPF